MAGNKKTLQIAFVGSGFIHFGGAEGPWDHATRLEKIGGVEVVAIIDPMTDKGEEALKKRRQGQHGHMYSRCKVLPDVFAYLESGERPDAMFVGVPPAYHGSSEAGKDIELRIVQAGIPVFVEKPLSVATPEEVLDYASKVNDAQGKHNVPVSVGYMFRYHAAVRKMKELIVDHGGQVMAFNGRFYLGYSNSNPSWWNSTLSGGPIVEQATHFCDLARFLVGDVAMDSVSATVLKESDAGGAGKLSHVPTGSEDGIPAERKVPRVTAATWRFEAGGLGTLMHAIALHGEMYELSIDVLMDGLRMTLFEPLTHDCKLVVRTSGSDDVQEYNFGDDDPYLHEIQTFLDAVRSGDASSIASPYEDAAKTYSFSWAIRRAGEK